MRSAPTDTGESSGRVLVMVANAGALERPLNLGAHLAQRHTLPLVLLVRDNTEMTALAELPFVREIDRVSGSAREFDALSAERMFTNLARQCMRRLAEVTKTLKLRTALEVVQGFGLERAFATALDLDVLIFGTQNSAPATTGLRVGVVYNPDDRGSSLAAGTDIAAFEHGRLHFLVPCADDNELAHKIRDIHQRSDIPRWTYEQVSPEPTAIFSAASASRTNLVVLSRASLGRDFDALSRYLKQGGRYVVLTP